MKKYKNVLCCAVAVLLTVGCFISTVGAVEGPIEILEWSDLSHEQVDMAQVEMANLDVSPYSFTNITISVSPYTICQSGYRLSLSENQLVSFSLTYTPITARLDIGLLDSNGGFHYFTSTGGNVAQSIRVSQSGTYQVAVRDRAGDNVWVSGFVSD